MSCAFLVSFNKRSHKYLLRKRLITGCAGFIGSTLAELLLSEGFKVIGVDNFDHFYSKLLKLGETMITKTGRVLAQRRTAFMRTYLYEFKRELGI